MGFLERISMLAGRYFALLVILFSMAGFLGPSLFVWAVPYIPVFLGIIMFGMGMTLTGSSFVYVLKRPMAVFVGVLAQYLLMPLAAYLIVRILNLPRELAVGVILVGTCPGGTASNVITYLSGGDVALSVTLTAVSTVISPVATPLLTLWLAGKWVPVSAVEMFLSIVEIVLLPVILGVLVNTFFGERMRRGATVLPLVSVSAIVFIIAAIVGINAGTLITVGGVAIAAVVFHNAIGLGGGYCIGRALRFGEKQRRTIAIEVGMQNSGLAVTLALLHFGPVSALPAAVFSVWHNISGSMLAALWSRRKA